MINNLEIIKYLTLNDIVSQNKLEKQLYLVDWFNCLKYDSQLSNFEWKSDNGPKAKGLNKLIHDNDDILKVIEKNNIKYINFELSELNKIEINDNDKLIIDYVLTKTKDMDISKLTDYVFSSYPFQSPIRFYDLDLEKLALEYIEIKNELESNNIDR